MGNKVKYPIGTIVYRDGIGFGVVTGISRINGPKEIYFVRWTSEEDTMSYREKYMDELMENYKRVCE